MIVFKKIIDLVFFIIIVIISLFLPYFRLDILVTYAIVLVPVILTIYIFYSNIKLFVPTLFFSINAVFSPLAAAIIEKYRISIPQIYFVIPIILYFIIIIFIKKFKKEITWLKIGKIDKISLLLMILMVFITAISLFLWAIFFKDEVIKFQKYIPDTSLGILILYGLLFPLFNSFFEEFMARAVLTDGFKAIMKNVLCIIVFQAIIFSLWHFKGFPGGIVGVIMVFVWSVFLGIIRFRTQGMLSVLITHYFADLSIAIILLLFVVLPKGIAF